MEPNNLKISTLNDLDDFILLRCIEFLSLDDLCSIKGVSRRFQILANDTFERRFASQIHFENLIEKMPEISRTIKCFGNIITNVALDGSFVWDLNTSILKLLSKNCSKLKKLRLICLHFDKIEISIMKKLAKNLETIELFYCTINIKYGVNYNVFLKEADKMKEFVFIGRDEVIDLKCLNKCWTYMEKLEIMSARLVDEEVLVQFLRKNRKVKHFGYMSNLKKSSWIDSFDNNALYLTELSIELNNNNINYMDLISGLTNLRRIVINCQGYDKSINELVGVLSKMKTIEVFGLWNASFHDFTTLQQFPNLQTLELRKMNTFYHLNTMILALQNSWNQVKNIYLDYSVICNANDIGLLVEEMEKIENIYLCDMKGFFLMPHAMQFQSWCKNRLNPLNIFVDSRYFVQHAFLGSSQKIVFQPFKDRISQIVNVICSANL